MSLKRRDITAVILLVLASVLWGALVELNQNGSHSTGRTGINETGVYIQMTTSPVTVPREPLPSGTLESEPASTERYEAQGSTLVGKLIRCILGFSSFALAVGGIFLLRQRRPIFGPDGALALLAAGVWLYDSFRFMEYILFWPMSFLVPLLYSLPRTLAFLLFLREIWGWWGARLSGNWIAVGRLAGRCKKSQLSLMTYVFWLLGWAVLGLLSASDSDAAMIIFFAAGIFGIIGLWSYGVDLHHFLRLLEQFHSDSAIEVREGAFSQAERSLQVIQSDNKEAIQNAVTSERFKVELITNVSHDLRTPLTSIVGYGELLEGQVLTAQGKEYLTRLNQKAGYMSQLVDSLFELTKVSSGVLPGKMEQLDLVRLLEQTIGLFDDQLSAAGLEVRRRYGTPAMPVVTDGARMHQVFANLLSNAIKYALPGTRIYLEGKELDKQWQIQMTNTASYEMDFTPEQMLQRFARGDKARSTQGSGIGLAIAQTYTESVGGRFQIAIDGDQFRATVLLPKTERNL